MKRVFSFLMCIVALLSLSSCGAQKINVAYFGTNFNPFAVVGNYDFGAVALTQATLVTTKNDNICYDAYSQGLGIADISIKNDSDGNVVYIFKIGDNAKFSNGEPITATDVIFSLYTYADINYFGWSAVGSSAIKGLNEYRYNNSKVAEVEIIDEQVEAELKNPSQKTKDYILKYVILPVLYEEFSWVEHLYTDDAYLGTEAEEHIKLYPNATELFAFYYSLKTDYKPSSDKEQTINDIASWYSVDCKVLSDIYGTDLTASAKAYAKRSLIETALADIGGEPVNTISGIKKVDDKTVEVTMLDSAQSELMKALGVFVVPYSVYGKGSIVTDQKISIDIESALDKTLKPVGAGPCVFDGYKNSKLKFKKNKHYFGKAEIDCNIVFYETGNSNTSFPGEYLLTREDVMLSRSEQK